MEKEQLKTLRAAIAQTDRVIIEHIAARMELVAKIAMLKRKLQIPTKDPAVEDELMNANKKIATECGVPLDLVEKISLLLIRSSLEQQDSN